MPGFYRKKKRKVGPSKNDEKVQRGREAQAQAHAAGTLSSRVPGLKALSYRIAVSSPQGVVLAESDDSLGADDSFQIEADCPGRCGSGSFDFAEAVSQSLARRDERGSAQATCAEPLYGGGPESCGCLATCEFEAEYSPS